MASVDIGWFVYFSLLGGVVSDVSIVEDVSGVGDGYTMVGGCESVGVLAEVEVGEDRGATDTRANA